MNRSGSRRSWLPWRLGDERERVQTVGEFRGQKVIDQAMPLDPAPAIKLRRHYPDAIMRAPSRTRSRVSRMTIRFIEDIEGGRIESFRQSRDNSLLHDHKRTPVKPIVTPHDLCRAV